jgi:hypothetical protein
MKIRVSCEDKYEAQKLASLLFIKDVNETFITAVLNIVDNELIVALKDKSAHSIVLKDKTNVEIFADFIQSVIEKEHKIVSTVIFGQEVEIAKE